MFAPLLSQCRVEPGHIGQTKVGLAFGPEPVVPRARPALSVAALVVGAASFLCKRWKAPEVEGLAGATAGPSELGGCSAAWACRLLLGPVCQPASAASSRQRDQG